MRIAKIILIGVFGIFAIALGWYYYDWRQEDFMPSKEYGVTINIGNSQKLIYLKAKIWGVSGNHEEIFLSESNTAISNKAVDYIFYTSEVYYKIENNSTIILYAPESSISEPANDFSNITVKVKVLKTAEEMNDYEAKYEKYGLKKISVNK